MKAIIWAALNTAMFAILLVAVKSDGWVCGLTAGFFFTFYGYETFIYLMAAAPKAGVKLRSLIRRRGYPVPRLLFYGMGMVFYVVCFAHGWIIGGIFIFLGELLQAFIREGWAPETKTQRHLEQLKKSHLN